jgi:large subunit ribosomal protein L3
MSRLFREDGTEEAVTYLEVEPNTVLRWRTREHDGYDAVVLGVGAKPWRTRRGKEHVRYRLEREFCVESFEGLEVGTQITAAVIPVQSVVTLTGISKGKGFQGVIKRHGFSSGAATHGSHQHREPGSVGCRAKPGRIHKGKRMPGRMGRERVTVQHRPVLLSDPQEQLLGVKGPVPGPRGAFVSITLESTP